MGVPFEMGRMGVGPEIGAALEDKRPVPWLVFSRCLVWDRNGVYRTPGLSLPFRTLEGFCDQNIEMVPRRGLEPPRGCPH